MGVLADAQRLGHTGTFGWKVRSGEVVWSDETYRILGYARETNPTLELIFERIHPQDRDQVRHFFNRATQNGMNLDFEHRLLMPDGAVKNIYTVVHAVSDNSGDLEYIGVVTDITESKRADEERQAHLWFLENMDRINRAIRGADDLEQVMSNVLDVVLSIFGCDRAWMVYPCDPDSQTWRTVMAHTRPEFSDSLFSGSDSPMDAEVAHMHRIVRASETPVRFGPGADNPIPGGIAERFSVRSLMCVAIYPNVDKPYMFGLDQCTRVRSWTEQEQRLFEATGQRLASLLTSLSVSRDLQESKARLEEAQRVAHVGHWEWDLETDAVVWSDETYRIFGLRPQERPMDLATVRSMVHSEDRESLYSGVDEDLLAGVRPDAEFRIVLPNGEVRTVHALTSRRWSSPPGDSKRDAVGRPYKLFGTIQDITERRRVEETLQRIQAHFREGQRLARMGGWTSDASDCYWSDELYEIYGFNLRNGRPTTEEFLAVIHPQDRGAMADAIKMMHEQHCGCDVTNRIVRPDGELRYIRCVGIPVVEEGAFKGFLGIGMDVTDQELLTQELRREEAYLSEAQSLAHISSWACNLVTKQVFHSSDENARLYGFDTRQGAIPFERYYDAILAEDEPAVRAKLEDAIRAGADYDVEFRIRRTDGAIRFLRGIGHHSPSAEPGEYVGVTMDITERKSAEEERERLRQLEADLAHINRLTLMGELAAALAHEIKQPIAASITSANACLRWLAHDPPNLERARAAATRIKQDGNRAADVINSLRSFYKKGASSERRIIDLKDIIREMTVLLRNEAIRHSVTIHTEVDPQIPDIRADRVQLQQVFMNLMMNGIEAMKDKGGELKISSRRNPEGELITSISDTGVGLLTENAERIFDAFHTTKPQGTGMGLAITRSIVESHGGRVWATANAGAGASFHFTLPIEAEAHA